MVVIGAGRVGRALIDRARQRGAEGALVSRDHGWEALEAMPGAPILLAVRNDDLLDVVAKVPEFRRSDLVFIQNGALRDLLGAHGLSRCTRGLLYFAVPTRGAPIDEGGSSVFCGDHAAELTRWFGALGLAAQTVDWARFSAKELEKLIWNCAFGLLCQLHDAPVGKIISDHRPELSALTAELITVGRAAMGVELPLDWLLERLVAYSATIPDYQGAVKEWPWRNGWFVGAAQKYGLATPLHTALLSRLP